MSRRNAKESSPWQALSHNLINAPRYKRRYRHIWTSTDKDLDMNRLLLGLGVVLAACGPALAGGHPGCCADCGCNRGLKKVCRWVCKEVEVKEPAWDCKCEDVVIPGKSPFCIQEACDSDERGHLLFGGRLHHKKLWGPPSGSCVKTVTLLMPTEKTVKKKVWKPVVETVCDTCCNKGTASGAGRAGRVDRVSSVSDRTPRHGLPGQNGSVEADHR